jgi:hypothetical protein
MLGLAILEPQKFRLDVEMITGGYQNDDRQAIKWVIRQILTLARGSRVDIEKVPEGSAIADRFVAAAGSRSSTDTEKAIELLAAALGTHPNQATRYLAAAAQSGIDREGHDLLGTI